MRKRRLCEKSPFYLRITQIFVIFAEKIRFVFYGRKKDCYEPIGL